MEQIEAQIQEKGIEKSDDVIPNGTSGVQKPRKPRSQAQKDAFEKARKKRAENLAKKKLGQEKAVGFDENQNQTLTNECPPTPVKTNPDEVSIDSNSGNASKSVPQGGQTNLPKKKRGRPKGAKGKKLKREIEPELGQPNFLPPNQPPAAGDLRYQYQHPTPQQFNPMMMYQPPPQVHNYYYGHQQGAVQQGTQPPQQSAPKPTLAPEPEVEPEFFDVSSEDSVDYLPAPEPDLKYRFA